MKIKLKDLTIRKFKELTSVKSCDDCPMEYECGNNQYILDLCMLVDDMKSLDVEINLPDKS
jgi:hypothetical protein